MQERLLAVVKKLLYRVAESPTLSQASKQRIDGWLQTAVSPIEEALSDLLDIGSEAGITPTEIFRELWAGIEVPVSVPDVDPRFFREVPLAPHLTVEHLQEALNETQTLLAAINRDMRQTVGRSLHHFIQANSFSGIVSNMLTDALDRLSPYKHNHEQRYPDLKDPQSGVGLEVKAANKAGKGGESHNGHGGWHLVACFDHNRENGNIRFVHIEIAELISFQKEPEGDWHYCGSTVGDEGSQRTETYYTTGRGTSKLRDGSIYLDTDRVDNWQRWRHCKLYPIPQCSPLYFQSIEVKRAPDPDNPDRELTWQTVRKKLNERSRLWPLMNRSELEDLGLPMKLTDLIRPT